MVSTTPTLIMSVCHDTAIKLASRCGEVVKPVSFGQLAAASSILTMLGVPSFFGQRGKLYLKQQTTPKDIVLFIFTYLLYHYSKRYHLLTFSQALQCKKLFRNISSAILTVFFQCERENYVQISWSSWCVVSSGWWQACSYGIWKEVPFAHCFLLSFLLAHLNMHTGIIISFISSHF